MGTKFNDLWNDPNFINPERKTRIDLEAEIIVKIIEAREKRGLTQQQLAELTGLKQANIARLEKSRAMPKIDTLLKVLEPLGYTLSIVPKQN